MINRQVNIANNLANSANYMKNLLRMGRKYCVIVKDTNRTKAMASFSRWLMMNRG